MTSSLVGSEMCIRDSLGFAAFSLSRPLGTPGGVVRTRPRWKSKSKLLWDCLLYTSDAADDM
eukprot:708404-Prorocentrum_lima.AAC.1